MGLSICVFGNIGKIGDEMVCLPAYYVLKCLYPNSYLTLISNSDISKNLFTNLDLIDDIIPLDIYRNKVKKEGFNREFDILLVINHNSINTLKIAKTIPAKRRIATFSQTLMFKKGIFFMSKIERFINPYWSQSHMEIQRYINLVREIDHKIFDKNYHFIDFNQIKLKTSKIHKDCIDKVFQNIKYNQYDKIIGICPFSQTSMRKDMNFNLNEWLKIVDILSNRFQNYLFLVLSYPKANNFNFQKSNVFLFKK